MEFSTEAVIRPDQTLDEMLISLSEERFLELTRLRDHYPAHGIEFTTPGRHRELVAQIEEMRQSLEEQAAAQSLLNKEDRPGDLSTQAITDFLKSS